MLIQLYSGVKDNIGKEIDISHALRLIEDGPDLTKKTAALRRSIEELAYLKTQAEDTEHENEKKKWQGLVDRQQIFISKSKNQLPGVTWSGTFATATNIKKEFVKDFLSGKLTWAQLKNGTSKRQERTRAIDQINFYASIIVLDFDKLTKQELAQLREMLCKDPHTYVCFTSPSGNGFKVLFKVAGDDKQHYNYFLSIEQYILDKYGKKIDPSGKDVSRLCFLCNDQNLYTNESSKVFDKLIEIKPLVEKPFTKKDITEFEASSTTHDVFLFTEKKISYTPGNRNRFLNLFCNNCNRKGISMSDCSDYCFANMTDREHSEIVQTVENAYNKNQHEHAKYAKKIKPDLANNKSKNGNTLAKAGSTASNRSGLSTDGRTHGVKANYPKDSTTAKPVKHTAEKESFATADELFWYTSLNEKTKKETLSLSYGKFFDWLEKQGFYNLKLDKKSVELIRIENGIVDPVIIDNTQNDVKTYINNFCKRHQLRQVLEMLHRGEDKYFSRKKFINLNFKTIEFLRDSVDQSFYFHNNCVVEVTKFGITTRPYKDGEKALWRSQIIEKDFNYVPFEQPFDKDGRIDARQMKCEWAQFQALVSSHPDIAIDAKTANNRFYSHATSFGYLINGYKPSDGKAIVAVDHQKGQDRMQQNGRTGKGVVAKAVGYAKKRYNVNGRTYDPRDSSVFDAVTMDVKVITVTDCGPNFDFGNFFVPITEDFTFRKLYIGYITIPFALSPKWYFDTNFSFKGDGGSFEGRQHIIEFDNFFTPTHRPAHFFGHQLFIDWDEAQWNLFYNYCYWCDMFYKQNGLVEYPSGNYSDRKLMNECPQEFIDWLDATNPDGSFVIAHNKKLEKLIIYGEWKTYAEQWGITKSSAKAFTGYMQKYCAVRNLEYIRHKTGSKEYVWISDGTIEAEKLKIMGELQFK